MIPFLKIGLIAAAGNILSDLGLRIFRDRETPMQAVQSINWTRVIISVVVAILAFFLVRQFWPGKGGGV